MERKKLFQGRDAWQESFTRYGEVAALSIIMFITGLIINLSWITKETRNTRLNSLAPDQRVRLSTGTLDFSQEYMKLQDEVNKLRLENSRYQNAISKETDEAELLHKSLQEAKRYAALTAIEGGGISLTLKDYEGADLRSPLLEGKLIHDIDIIRVVNELWAAGAEAITVNNYRIGIGISFRCVGPVIMMNGTRIASPVVINAIGDVNTLLGAINMPGGAVDEIKQFGHPSMIQVVNFKKMRLPAYTGSTSFKYSVFPEDS